MQSTASELLLVINEYLPKLKTLDEGEAALKPSPSKWSKKEITGHLIDSAQNNLRRFIVAQYEDNPEILYKQDDWVRINSYQSYSLTDLINLWYLLNKQIVTVLSNTTEQILQRTSKTDALHTIDWLAKDYIKHTKHHLHKILDLLDFAYP